MGEFSTETMISMLALVGAVIIIATMLSGLIERSSFPQVAAFLLLGAMVGPAGLNLLNLTLDSPVLRIVATISLVLVLFNDAISLNLGEVRKAGPLVLLVLGPGTLLSAALIAVAGWGLLGLAPAAAIILGAALASTDPVLLQGFLRMDGVPNIVRQVLRLESGLNDVVLLPIVLIAMGIIEHGVTANPLDWARLAMELFLLGPGAGVVIALIGVATLDLIRRHIGIRRDYESLFSLGIAFSAYAAAEAVHGSGFLAVFAAGVTIAVIDVELCDCFVEYGETTAELTLLFTFVLFGSSLIWSGLTILNGMVILFVVLALVVRPIAYLISLSRVRLAARDRLLIAWFGPRGLSSLLLVLLPVFANLPGSATLFSLCSLVVLLSVVVHGSAPMILIRRKRHHSSPLPSAPDTSEPLPPVQQSPDQYLQETAAVPDVQPAETEKGACGVKWEKAEKTSETSEVAVQEMQSSDVLISIEEVRKLWKERQPIIFLDVRTPRSYEESNLQIRGALRFPPARAIGLVRQHNLPRDTWLIAYCT